MLFTEKALGHYSRYDRYHTTVTTVTTVTYEHRTLVPGSPPVVPQRISSKFMRNLGALGAKPAKEIWVASERNSGLGQAVRRVRPILQDVRPGIRDAPAKFYMVRASGHTRYCLKGNGVTFPASHQVFPTEVVVESGSTPKARPMQDSRQMLPYRSWPPVMKQDRSCSSTPRALRHDHYLRRRSRTTLTATR